MLSVIKLNVIKLSVVVPEKHFEDSPLCLQTGKWYIPENYVPTSGSSEPVVQLQRISGVSLLFTVNICKHIFSLEGELL